MTHAVLEAQNAPLDGSPRGEKTYAKTTPPQRFRIDSPDLTTIFLVEYARNSLLASD